MQMHWEVLIIPLIAIGVWVLSTIFKGVEDERQKERLRRGPGNQGGGPRPRRPVTDLDRFLEEARRRRQTAAQPRLAEPVQEVRPRPSEQQPTPPPPRPVPVPPRAAPARTERPRPVRTQPAVRRVEPAPTRRPIPMEPVTEVQPIPVVVPVADRPEPTSQPAPSPSPAPPPAAPATVMQPQPASPALARLVGLLRSPQSAATAFVLREIIDEPKCKRR
jgi:outer membrane biosynthesis protein TonB